MESKVKSYIVEYNLLKDNQIVLVGLSGGADSVSLVLVLQHLGYNVIAAHCNFHLRGAESDRDEEFVTRFCAEKGIPLHKAGFDTCLIAKEQGISIEMAARNLRYSYFKELMESEKIDKLAVAHHKEDQAETILINLIRGTGIHGLRGMLPEQHDIIRPLLCVGRDDILSYLVTQEQDYVTDSSNLETDYLRNIIRLEVIPKLKILNPSLINSLNNTAEHMRQAEDLYVSRLHQLERKIILDKEYVLGKSEISLNRIGISMKSAEMKAVWYEILSIYGFNSTQVQEITSLSEDNSGQIFYSKDFCLYISRDKAFLKRKDFPTKYSLIISETDNKISLNNVLLEMSSFYSADYTEIEKSSSIAILDKDKLVFPLTLRTVQQGDKFIPFGMKGKKLLSNFLTDLKVSPVEKQEQLVLCNFTGEIIWVVGRRISNTFALTTNTENIYRIKKITT